MYNINTSSKSKELVKILYSWKCYKEKNVQSEKQFSASLHETTLAAFVMVKLLNTLLLALRPRMFFSIYSGNNNL